jgi:hypothetical protein
MAVTTDIPPVVIEKVEKAREKAPEKAPEQETTSCRKSTANAGVNFDLILQGNFEDAVTAMLATDSLEVSQPHKPDKKTKKRKGKSREGGMTAQDLRLRDVYGLWADFEDVELEKQKMDW